MFHDIPFKLSSNLAFNAFKVLKEFVNHFKRLVGTSAKILLSIFNCGYLFNLTCKTIKTTMKEQREREERKENKIIMFDSKKEFCTWPSQE